MREAELYPFIKHYLEKQGYCVKAEVNDCDVVARRGDEPPVVVEMKTSFSLTLLLQAVDRLGFCDDVYVAAPKPSGKSASALWRRRRRSLLKLCRRLGVGLLLVDMRRSPGRAVEALLDPAPYQPRKDKRRTGRLLKEFEQRVGDPNVGGVNNRPIITAYRQDALRCLSYIERKGPAKLRDIREQTEVERAGNILQKDHYGWFERVDRGVYAVTAQGKAALHTFSDALGAL